MVYSRDWTERSNEVYLGKLYRDMDVEEDGRTIDFLRTGRFSIPTSDSFPPS